MSADVGGTLNFTFATQILHNGEALASLAAWRHTSQHTKKRGGIVSDSKLRSQSMDFAVAIINLVKELKSKRESIISNQIGRSGTSIGANIREAQYAHGKADFVSKLQIALKEASETGYWLELLYRTGYISQSQYAELDQACTGLRVMLIASINTVKKNMNQQV